MRTVFIQTGTSICQMHHAGAAFVSDESGSSTVSGLLSTQPVQTPYRYPRRRERTSLVKVAEMAPILHSPFSYFTCVPAQRAPHLPFVRPPQNVSSSSWIVSRLSSLRVSQANQTAETSTESAETSKARVTIKELCRGRVPHHILQRQFPSLILFTSS